MGSLAFLRQETSRPWVFILKRPYAETKNLQPWRAFSITLQVKDPQGVMFSYLQHILITSLSNWSPSCSHFPPPFLQWRKRYLSIGNFNLPHCLFAKVFLNPLRIFPNHIKFIAESTAGTTNTKKKPNACICITCHTWSRTRNQHWSIIVF